MIVNVQFGTTVLRPALSRARVDGAGIERADATGTVPLRTTLWLADRDDDFGDRVADRARVRDTRRVVGGDEGTLYNVTYNETFDGATVYRAAIERCGCFLGGRAEEAGWRLRFRFPDRETLGRFRERCEAAGVDGSVAVAHESETTPRAERFGLSEAQLEVLLLATEEGYFEVPREASLSGLAEELGVSGQAASERIRRGLDSLVERALVTPG